MASRRFTVDPAKKKKFLNFILQMPKLCVPDAMKLAMFSDEDITDLRLRCFLQRALPGGTVEAMEVHLGAFHPPNSNGDGVGDGNGDGDSNGHGKCDGNGDGDSNGVGYGFGYVYGDGDSDGDGN
jgi:hypothetical protein